MRRGVLLDGTPQNQTTWMSHGDAVRHRAPRASQVLATSSASPVAAFEDRERRLYTGRQRPGGQALRARPDGAGALPVRCAWPELDARTSSQPGRGDPRPGLRRVGHLRALGGVDSAVAAALVQRAVATQSARRPRADARGGEEQIERDFVAGRQPRDPRRERSGSLLRSPGTATRDEAQDSLGREFIRVFEEAARQIVEDAGARAILSPVSRGTGTLTVVRVPEAAQGARLHKPPQRRRPPRTTCKGRSSSRCASCSSTSPRAPRARRAQGDCSCRGQRVRPGGIRRRQVDGCTASRALRARRRHAPRS